MASDLRKVVVFIPAFNEEEKIADTIRETLDTYKNSSEKGYKIEIIVIDDGSTDKTSERAEQAGVRVFSHPVNLGLGAATRTGMQQAYEMGADVAVKLDADLQHDPKDIESVVMPVLRDKADIVWGSRFSGKIHYKMPLYRRWGNKTFTFLMNVLTNYKITDAQTGLMAYGKRYLANFQILTNYNPPQQILLDANSKYMRYAEVPVQFYPRTSGRSFVSFKYPFKAMVGIARLLTYANPLRVFVPIGTVLVLASFAVAAIDLVDHYRNMTTGYFRHEGTIVMFFIGGIQIMFFGILADLIMKKK